MKLKGKLKREYADFKLFMQYAPTGMIVVFVVSVVLMNILANKEVKTGIDWLVLDAGVLVSWICFLSMDTLTKRFGPKPVIKLSLFTVAVSLGVSVIMKIASMLDGVWGEYYTFENVIVNQALDNTIAGTWFVLMGSMIAFVVSAIANVLLNHLLGTTSKLTGFKNYAFSAFTSTMFAQFVDNLVFSLIVSHTFFGWTLLQCVVCAITGCVVELLAEIIFAPIGYRIYLKWKHDGVGKQYLNNRRA